MQCTKLYCGACKRHRNPYCLRQENVRFKAKSKDKFCNLLKELDMHLRVVVSVFCLSAESYRASKPKESQDKRQNNKGKQLNDLNSCKEMYQGIYHIIAVLGWLEDVKFNGLGFKPKG